MSSSPLIRWSGLASLLGGLWWAVAMVYHGVQEMVFASAESDAFEKLSFLPLLLLMLGLVGVHKRQAGRTGWLGWTGFGVALIGLAVALVGTIGDLWLDVASGGPIFFVGFVIVFIGLVLFGIATRRANVLPRWRSIPFLMGVVGLLLFVSGAIIGGLGVVLWLLVSWILVWGLFGAGWVVLGYLLWTDTAEMREQFLADTEEASG